MPFFAISLARASPMPSVAPVTTCVCVCVCAHSPDPDTDTTMRAGGAHAYKQAHAHTHTAQEPSFLMFLPGRRKVMKANLATLDTSLSVHTTPITAKKTPDPCEHQNSRTHTAAHTTHCKRMHARTEHIHTRARTWAQITQLGARSWRRMIAHAPWLLDRHA